jgi:transcriptional regulator with XRE-family HTH domain
MRKKSPDDPKWHFAERVARLQRDRGLSNQALADRAKLDLVDLEAILRTEGQVALDAIFLLAGALDVEPGELLAGIAWVPDEEGSGEYRVDDPEGG